MKMRDKVEYRRLGDVADYINGYAFKPEDWKESGLPIIRIQNLNNTNATFNYYDGIIDNKYLVKNGDLLISWSASLGAYIWNGSIALLNQHIFKVVFGKSSINKRFLKYAVNCKLDAMKSMVHGVTMQHIVKKDFDNTLIPYPPLEEQERIVAELDLISGVIEKQKTQLKELDNLAQSIFYDMFGDPVTNEKGWNLEKMSNVCSTITDGDHNPPPKSEQGIPFITISNIDKINYGINFQDTYYVPVEYYNNIKEEKKPLIGDVLYTVTGSYGIPIIVNKSNPFCFQRHIGLLRPTNIILPVFLASWLKSEGGKSQADMSATGIAQKTVSLSSIKNFIVPTPPLPLQQEFAQKIQAIEKQKAFIKKSIDETQKLFDYTMDKYFYD